MACRERSYASTTLSRPLSCGGGGFFLHQRCLDKRGEQRVASTWRRFELRMVLHAHIPWVGVVARAWQFHDFAQIFARRTGRNDQASRFDTGQVMIIGFVTMTVTLGHYAAVDLGSQGARIDGAGLRAQAHGTAQVRVFIAQLDFTIVVLPLIDQCNYRLIRIAVELGRVGVRHASLVARVLDQGDLHAKADAQVRNLVFTGKLGSLDLAFHATLAEAARYQDGVVLGQVLATGGFDFFRIDVHDIDAAFRVQAGVTQRFDQRFVRFGQFHIFADHADGDFRFRMFQRVDQLAPDRQVGRCRIEVQRVADDLVETLVMQHLRHFVDGVDVPYGNHGVFLDVREQRDFCALIFWNRTVSTAQQRIRQDADFAQLLYRVLGRLGFQLTGRSDVRHQGQVHEGGVFAASAQAQLTCCFQEWQRLDIADGAADFAQGHIVAFCATTDVVLDFIGDVWNHLHGFAQIFAAAFLADHRFIDLAGGEVIHLFHAGGNEALVVAEVEVGFGPVVGNENFTVLHRAHRARIDVDIRVELEHGDFKAARFEDRGERGGGNPFSKGRHNATSDEDKFGHCRWCRTARAGN